LTRKRSYVETLCALATALQSSVVVTVYEAWQVDDGAAAVPVSIDDADVAEPAADGDAKAVGVVNP